LSAEALRALAGPCRLCPRRCGALRDRGETGFCKMPLEPVVSCAGPHFGEEPVLVGEGGSGTIFLAGCNLLCLFCQNYDISHERRGERTSPGRMARVMLKLQEIGCANVNFVTPTHFAHAVAEAIELARGADLSIPVVYNCGGFESVEAIEALEGLVDIYMPDVKTLDAGWAQAALQAISYPEAVKAAVIRMQRQVGDLEISEDGIAKRGLLVRHLVMPGMAEDGKAVVDFLADEVSPRAFVNVMGQYRPRHRAGTIPGCGVPPTAGEIGALKEYAARRGLRLSD